MTLKTKNIILNTSTTINSVILLILVYMFITFPDQRDINLLVLLSISSLTFISSIFVYVYFKKSLPAEIVLYTIFLISLSMQSIRLLKQFIDLENFMTSIISGRISIFFKYLGLLSLLGTSLFSYSIKKQKVGSWLLLTLLGSVIISSILHFNTGVTNNNLLPKIIFNNEELVMAMAIIVLTFLTLIKSGVDSKNKEYIFLAISTTILSISLMLTFFSITLFSGIIITILFITSSISYLRSIHNISLWG